MARVARCFGESENLDFDHLPESRPSISIDSLKGKLEDESEMTKVAEEMIQMENYTGAQKIWDHIDLIHKVKKILDDKKQAAADEKYELAMQLRDEAAQIQDKMLNEQQISDLLNSKASNSQPTLKFLLNQVLYRVDDAMAQYFVPKYIEKYQNIDARDFDRKISLKKEIMIEALTLLKVAKIGIEQYKLNWDGVILFIVNEVRDNLKILNELKTEDQEVLDALKEEEKFSVFIKGIKALYQILTNMHESTNILNRVDTKYTMDIEVFCQEIDQGLKTMNAISSLLNTDFGISPKLMKTKSTKDKILNSEETIDEGFESIIKDKYNNICSLCATYISNGDEKENEKAELHLPERRLVFNNKKGEQQTYHNYCINLWINKTKMPFDE